jgi:NAD(P)H-flavin reductase
VKLNPDRLRVKYVVEESGTEFDGEKGIISADMIKTWIPSPNSNALVLVCGPDR